MKTTLPHLLFLIHLILIAALPISAWAESAAEANAAPQQEAASNTVSEMESAEAAEALVQKQGALMSKWLHMLDSGEITDDVDLSVLAYAPQVPKDLARILESTADTKDKLGVWGVLGRVMLAIVLGFLIAFILKRIFHSRIEKLKDIMPPDTKGVDFLWLGFLRSLPLFISLLLFAIISTIVFMLFAGSIGIKGRMLFQMVLGAIVIFMACSIVGRIIFSPDDRSVRPVNIDESLIKPLYKSFYISTAVLLSGILLVRFTAELGAYPQTVSWVVIVLGSLVISIYGYLIYYLKQPVADVLLEQLERQGGGWFKKQISTYWHGFAWLYLLIIWFIWIGQKLTGAAVQSGALIFSMLIVPVYFILSYSGKLIIYATVESLNLGDINDDGFPEDTDEATKALERENKKIRIAARAHLILKIVLIAVLFTWFLSLWGYNIPFANEALGAVFQSFIAFALALACWRFANRYIENKLKEAEPEEQPKEEDIDDEFGGAAQRGRSHTLLPMLRKVIGSVLVVMVLLIVISSLGINITPLLAGAGVLGLAIGFGAQKLVSDVLSGFFFLLDDAFRVGEYIQTGSIKGTVEAITLRNVMLRHHRGMLQIVPHSDLGAVTNYMRGGIVIKFPLEFPYDTNIDQVRKIIKKVGIAMLEDEELGDDFLLPVKSQGVNEITNSVMVIRVKFTAKPGKQFVIKREAFRRITEALNAKGIYYAHRKVIVDFPEDSKSDLKDEQTRTKALEAGAAAIATEIDMQKQEEAKQTK